MWVGVELVGAIQIDESQLAKDAEILQDEGEAVMARVIEFYIPMSFRRKAASVPQSQPGKVIAFYLLAKKSA